MFCTCEFALWSSVIVLLVSAVFSVEINKKCYYQSNLHTSRFTSCHYICVVSPMDSGRWQVKFLYVSQNTYLILLDCRYKYVLYENIHYFFVFCLIEYLIQQWPISFNSCTRTLAYVFQLFDESVWWTMLNVCNGLLEFNISIFH